MNKIAKRLVAGASAAALLVSAVGVDQLADLFTKTSYAASGSGKFAQSTGFNNLEQDTTTGNDKYNTGYGLHTNKTAKEVGSDGRTFDVNLESWYVGENPVDVATILDASGSMAWTVDTLKPLELNATSMGINVDELKTTYSINNADLEKFSDYKDELTKVLAAIQDKNKGYLPQEVVDLILDKTKTDNSKLSYAGYKYYVYENRSSVSEFVPLGYWDGGKTAEKFSPIGYYPFNGSLANSMGGTATYIKQAATGGEFDKNSTATITPQAVFSDGYLDLSETDQSGNIVIDLSNLDYKKSLEIKFTLNCGNIDKHCAPQSPILYLGDGTNQQYLALMRGRSHEAGSGASKNIYVYQGNSSDGTQLDAHDKNDERIPKGEGYTNDNSVITNDTNLNCEWKIEYNSDTKAYDITLVVGSSTYIYHSSADYFNKEKLYLVIGGDEILPKGSLKGNKTDDEVIDPEKLKGDADKNISIKNLTISGTYNDSNTYSETFTLKNADGLTGNNGTVAKYCEQGNIGDASLSLTEQVSKVAEPEYSDKALNLTQTAKLGAVLLDVAPKSSSFTISFKVKKADDDSQPNPVANILYMGKSDTSQDYYNLYRGSLSNAARMRMGKNGGTQKYVNINGAFDEKKYQIITLVFDEKNLKIKQYIDGEPYKDPSSNPQENDYLPNAIDTTDLSLILGGLFDSTYNGSDILIDDLYVFDKALDADQVAAVAKATEGQTQFAKVPSALTTGCKGYHATTSDGTKDIAQISERLAQNPNDDERRGWYYVNSHSKWADIEGCLESGKQYIGIYDKDKDNGIDNVGDAGRDIATIPSGADNDLKTAIKAGNTDDGTADHKKFNKAPDNERSIRFYVDSQNHLRCFAWSGSTSKKDDTTTTSVDETDIRTFCSLVYEKGYNDDDNSEQITKYEELNNALNTFYQKIAEKSDLSNNAVVRFSTNSAIGDNETATNKNLQKLIMKDWTNWSDFYQKYKEDNSGAEPKTTDYLQNLLIGNEKSSTDTTKSSHGIDEYPYVMTGGTYTWTGLKAFYDNMVNKDATDASQTTKDIANDARDKYLIIFTDGRDNTQDYNVSELDAKDNYENSTDKMAGSPVYDSGSNCKGTKYVNNYNPYADDPTHMVGFSIKNYNNHWDWGDTNDEYLVQKFVTEDHAIASDGDLAEAWADKLKDEGYTIYCVMMASGSISPTANADEYNKAKNFLKSLSGSNELDAQIAQMQAENTAEFNGNSTKPDGLKAQQEEIEALRDKYVIVVDPTAEDAITVTDAFEQILEQIQLPRNDYTVQDYIDPRFDLIGEAYVDGNEKPQEVIYHLGANGEVTFTDTNNKKLEEIEVKVSEDTKVTLKSRTKVGNIIDDITNTKIISLPYTPIESYMVNRKADSSSDDGYDTGNIGTGYIYYDDVKDMYYLRWTDQIIPMENEAFDTDKDHRNLDVWSATIRLKAKEDFIGGNNILTNGNEAGENLVYSDATIDNMTDNPELYGLAGSTYREKLAVLSGTDRKINAVDAGGVSQAVYGNGIDIPSSGFPRTTVNVRLLKLDAKNLNDVIYMGEVVSPTMMLADLENGYMTGSYYLQYLERYAYRLYGEDATKQPLLELLNQWLKINITTEESKTFTIPYIYLPDPEYDKDGKFTAFANSTGADKVTGDEDIYEDLNLRDVTGFITYTWKRDDEDVNGDGTIEGNEREPQQVDSATGKYDITKDYVAKNTKQIKYNLQLKFTPLKETAEELKDFKLDEYFIIADPTAGTGGDKFFNIVSGEFAEMTTGGAWTTDYGREDYLQAMIQEERTYEPHVMYDENAAGGGKWVLVDASTAGFAPADAVTAYTTADKSGQTTVGTDNKTVTDVGVYDWDSSYKEASGKVQLEGDLNTYTKTPENVNFADAKGNKIEGTTATDPVSLAANTTYTKDVVNAALALELFVDGKYLKGTDNIITVGTEYKFIATRDYKDPYNKPSYATEAIGANADSKKYQLTFKVTEIPDDAKENEISRVWAKLEEVQVEKTDGTYESIKTADGYAAEDALPIGTYEIKTKPDSEAETELNSLKNEQFKIAEAATVGSTDPLYFQYLKIDNDPKSYTHDRFPETVSGVSESAAESTKDSDYLIWNNSTDNSAKNIAESNRVKNEGTDNTYTLTFNFGTVDTTDSKGDKGVNRIKDEESDYAKDRLGIIMLSAVNNSLAITKEVKNTKKDEDIGHSWKFTITVKPDAADEIFTSGSTPTLNLKWYKGGELKTVAEMGTYNSGGNYPSQITFSDADSDNIYTATIYLKHDEKVVIDGLPEGTWQVVEDPDVFCTPHNDQFTYGEDEWQYNRADSTRADGIDLTPASQVNYINEFPYELPSTGGSGTVRYLLIGTALISVGAMLFAVLFFDRRKKARK